MKAINGLIYIITYFVLCSLLHSEPIRLTQAQKIVAMTILGEARGEGEAGMYAVGCIIAERSIAWGKTPTQVCLKLSQFSCWNKDDPNRAKLPDLLNIPEAAYAKRLAINLNNLKREYTKHADHYCHISKKPYWSYKVITVDNKKIKIPIKPVVIINKHKFYNFASGTRWHARCCTFRATLSNIFSLFALVFPPITRRSHNIL